MPETRGHAELVFKMRVKLAVPRTQNDKTQMSREGKKIGEVIQG